MFQEVSFCNINKMKTFPKTITFYIKQEIINMILDISQNDDILNKIDDPIFVNSLRNFHFNYVILNTRLE